MQLTFDHNVLYSFPLSFGTTPAFSSLIFLSKLRQDKRSYCLYYPW